MVHGGEVSAFVLSVISSRTQAPPNAVNMSRKCDINSSWTSRACAAHTCVMHPHPRGHELLRLRMDVQTRAAREENLAADGRLAVRVRALPRFPRLLHISELGGGKRFAGASLVCVFASEAAVRASG